MKTIEQRVKAYVERQAQEVRDWKQILRTYAEKPELTEGEQMAKGVIERKLKREGRKELLIDQRDAQANFDQLNNMETTVKPEKKMSKSQLSHIKRVEVRARQAAFLNRNRRNKTPEPLEST